MKKKKKRVDPLVKKLAVPLKGTFSLADVDASGIPGLGKKQALKAELKEIQARLNELQEILFAQSEHAVLFVLQAMDTGGKDSTIRRVFGALNPQGVRVKGFKVPTPEERAHDYLWRVHNAVPPKGMIGIFNRSHYEDVLVTRVHDLVPAAEIRKRYDQINAFEKILAANNVAVVKCMLYISKDEQKRRLQDRLDEPEKHWKFNSGDLAERKLWKRYMKAFELALAKCNTPWARWYVVPANTKTHRDLAVARILLHTLENLPLKYPPAEEGLDTVVIED